MFLSIDQFRAYIDRLIDPALKRALEKEISDDADAQLWDIVNIQERGRVLTIKEQISKTHTWEETLCVDNERNQIECFWCVKCNIRCSIFEHIHTTSILSKVKDRLPTYTIHNGYLMMTCAQLQGLRDQNRASSYECRVVRAPLKPLTSADLP